MNKDITPTRYTGRTVFIIAAIWISCYTGLASAADYSIDIRDHRFIPAQLEVTAGEKHRLIIINHDASAEEFESYALNREKVVAAHSRITIFLPALQPGQYPFFGEFHEQSAQGQIIVK